MSKQARQDEAKRLTSRFEPSSSSGVNVPQAPRLLRVPDLLNTRQPELQRFVKHLDEEVGFEPLARHLRRRALCHNRRKNPRRKRAVNKTVLETHKWHAKRFRMEEIWGMTLPSTPNEKGQRAIYEAAARRAVIHDRSYMAVFEFQGTTKSVEDFFRAIGLQTCGSDNKGRRVQGLVAVDGKTVTPVQVLWHHEGKRVLVFVHPSAASSFSAVVSSLGAPTMTQRSFAFFEITGPAALENLQKALPLVPSEASKFFLGLTKEEPLESGCALAVNLFSTEQAKGRAKKTEGQSSSEHSWIKHWPGEAYEGSKIWDEIDDSMGESNPKTRLPALILRRSTPAPDGFGAGFDLILPIEAANDMWLQLNYACCVPIGFRDRHELMVEYGIPEMPFDLRDTDGGRHYAELVKGQLETQHNKRPASKRINHALFNIPCPFEFDWEKVGLADENPSAIRNRESLMELWQNPSLPISSPLVAIRLISTKGTPAPFTHIYSATEEDFKNYLASVPDKSLRNFLEPLVGTNEIPGAGKDALKKSLMLEEPPLRDCKLKRVRAGTKQRPAPEPLRKLIGFLSSGQVSLSRGNGAGVGMVVAGPFCAMFKEQMGFLDLSDDRSPLGSWALVWVRNSDSKIYRPAWVQIEFEAA